MSIVRDEELLKNVKGSRIGRVLRKLGYVTREQVHEALQLQEGAKKGMRVGEILIGMGLLDEDKLESALAAQRGLGYVNLDEVELSDDVLAKLKPETATAYGVVPISFDSGSNRITIAIKNADNFQAVDDLKQLLGFRVSAVVAKPSKIDAILAARYAGNRPQSQGRVLGWVNTLLGEALPVARAHSPAQASPRSTAPAAPRSTSSAARRCG